MRSGVQVILRRNPEWSCGLREWQVRVAQSVWPVVTLGHSMLHVSSILMVFFERFACFEYFE